MQEVLSHWSHSGHQVLLLIQTFHTSPFWVWSQEVRNVPRIGFENIGSDIDCIPACSATSKANLATQSLWLTSDHVPIVKNISYQKSHPSELHQVVKELTLFQTHYFLLWALIRALWFRVSECLKLIILFFYFSIADSHAHPTLYLYRTLDPSSISGIFPTHPVGFSQPCF